MNPQMLALKHKLTEILGYFDKDQRCIYVDYPLHTNIGDLLINAGCEQFFAEQKVNIWRRYNYYDFPKRVPGLSKKDVFLLHGGGNLGDIWSNFQSFRERLMATHPDNRIVFLPQTVHFTSEQKAIASMERMNRHRNFHVFARDHRSLERLQRLGVRSASAMPDTAHALAGIIQPSQGTTAVGLLRLMRQDAEASALPVSLEGIKGDTCDWDSGFLTRRRKLVHFGVVNLVKGIGRYGPPIDCHSLWYWHRDKLIQDGIDLFSRYETVLTNRLHAMILGLLLNRRVIAFDNSYGKLSTYRDCWLPDVESLHFEESSLPRSATLS